MLRIPEALSSGLKTVLRALKTMLGTPKTTLLSLKAMLLTLAKWLGGLLTVASLLFVTYQYLDAKWKSRIERSLNLVLIYQDEAKTKARNQIDLSDDQMISTNDECEPYDKSMASNFETDEALCQKNRCMAAIHNFANDRVGPRKVGKYTLRNKRMPEIIDESVFQPRTRKIFDLSSDEGISMKSGGVGVQDDSLVWFDEGTTYAYSWPDITWKFFSSGKHKQECQSLLAQYKEYWSDELLQNLHTLKHFYATVAVCTTSGVCDSFVACNAFYREVGTFLAEWQHYFELWSAQAQSNEFYALHDFIKHCASNEEFLEYLDKKLISGMLYAQQFTNYCWGVNRHEDAFCGFLRWMTEIGAKPAADVTLTVHHFVERNTAAHERFIEPWAHRIEDQSQGRIKVDIFPAMEHGGAPEDLYGQVKKGDVDIVWTLIGYTPGEFPRSEVFELPTVHRGSALATTLAIQDVYAQIEPDYVHVRPLLIHVHAGQVILVEKPIRSVDDLANLKIRAPSGTAMMLIKEAWNATPVTMPVPELRRALDEGEVDGALLPYEIVLPYKIYELIEQSIEGPNGRRFGTSVFAFLMNKKRYDGLPDDLKAVIDANSGVAIAKEVGAMWDQVEKPGRKETIASGSGIIVLRPEEMADFDERSQRVAELWLENMKARDDIPGGEAEKLLNAATAAVRNHSQQRGFLDWLLNREPR